MGTNGQFGSIRKLPSGRYQVRYFHLGKRIAAETTFATKGDARAYLAGIETNLRRGDYVDPTADRITFAEYAGWWLEQRPLRPQTRETYESQMRHLIGPFGRAQLSEITASAHSSSSELSLSMPTATFVNERTMRSEAQGTPIPVEPKSRTVRAGELR